MKEVLGKQMKRARQSLGITMEDASRLIGVSQAAISRWESGENAPGGDLLPVIAKAYKVSLEWLYNLPSEGLQVQLSGVERKVPYWNLKHGESGSLKEDPAGYLEISEDSIMQQDFVIRVCGHGLEPLLHHGEYTAFRWLNSEDASQELYDGDVVLVKGPHTDCLTAKKYHFAGGIGWLEDGAGHREEEVWEICALAVWTHRVLHAP